MSNNAELFDESRATGAMDLYSRQIGTFGVETMKNLTKLRVLIVGLKGVGIETAKNLILAGPGAVTIYDNSKVEVVDLGTNFYFNETKIGKTKSEAALDQLQELNPYVEVTAYTGELSPEFIQTFGAVIITDHLPFDELNRINSVTHNRKANNNEAAPILFLLGLTHGVTASIFADFGPAHKVTDVDGEPAKVNVIEEVTVHKDNEGKSYVMIKVNSAQHKLDDDSIIQITDVDGMVELNQLGQTKITRVYKTMMEKGKPREILVTNKLRIDAPEIEKWGAYKSGGMISEIKPSKTLNFSPLSDSVLKPVTESDMGFVRHPNEEKMYLGRGAQLHFARLALWEFDKKNNRLPKLHNQEDANALVEIAKAILAHHKTIEGAVTVDEIDADVVKKTALYAAVELPGITAFLGGVLAQEVIKKFGKYTPIHQWIHLDYFELLSEEVPGDAAPVGSRHDNQIAVFGKAFQDKLEKQRWFMVGCGALGCEYLKGFALMGLGSGNGGTLYVTDMDTIEVSNLSRQFLFRRDNVRKLKSQTAAAAAKKMNPRMNIDVSDVPVGPDTENKFSDSFWSKLDGVCNALDNIKAREYTDSKCVFFEKPLLESGTLGTKANSEMVIPHKTKSYAQHEAGGEEEAIPMCTLRNFPHLIEHCIEWSRAMFTDLFESPAASFNKFIKDPADFFVETKKQKEAEALDVLEHVTKLATFFSEGANIEACIRFAFNIFISQFRDRILNLVTAFPENSTKTDENGITTPFWSGSKRFPRGFEFNPDDEFHFSFIYNCANLYASVFKIPPVTDQNEFKKILLNTGIKAPEFQPDKKFMSQVQNEVKEQEKKDGEKNKKEQEFTDEDRLNKLFEDLKKVDTKSFYELNKAEFEKDDDTNFHIDFITACSNMRALNYKLQTATRHKCKMIAGRIIPAVATTTAMITGLVEMELYKLILGLPVEKFCNSNINLALSDFKLFEPVGPKKAKEAYDPEEDEIVVPVPDGWSIWDKVIIDKGDLTVEELVQIFPSIHHGCTFSFLFFKNDNNAFWLDFPITNQQKTNNTTNFKRKISEIYAEKFGALPADKYYIPLNAAVKNKDDKPASVPPIILIFRHL